MAGYFLPTTHCLRAGAFKYGFACVIFEIKRFESQRYLVFIWSEHIIVV